MARQLPFTTPSGLQIGCMYQASRPIHHDKDALRIQAALLNRRQPGAIEMAVMHLVRRFWAWC